MRALTSFVDLAAAIVHDRRLTLTFPQIGHDLNGTAVTDAGVRQLAKLPRLRFLALNKAKVTPRGAKELKQALPDCAIYLDASLVE